MREAGALYQDSDVVVDGNLVTSRQPSDQAMLNNYRQHTSLNR